MRASVLRWLFCLLLALPGAARAQQPDSEGFVKESLPPDMNPKKENISATPLVAAAYGFIWLAVLGFAVSVALRSRRLEEEVAALRRRLEGRGG